MNDTAARCGLNPIRKIEEGKFRKLLSAWICVLYGILTAGTTAKADEQWTKLATVPYTLNNKQDAISFANADSGWYGNGTGSVYRTSDLGEHWSLVWKHAGTYVRSLEFIDEKVGFLGNVGPGYFPGVVDNHPLYITKDGGDHWSPVQPTTGLQITGVCAIDILKIDGKVLAIRAGGRVGGPAGMLESFDGGRTFQARDMGAETGMILDIHFIDQNVGFVAGASEQDEEKAHARILKTTDGGKTWQAVFESDRPGDNNWKLSFPTAEVGYGTIISYQAPEGDARGYVVKTTDAGKTWNRLVVTHDEDWVPYGVNFLDASHGWVGGSSGGYETRDGGSTWLPVRMGLSSNKIRFVTRSDGRISAFAIGQGLYRLDLPRSRSP